jgi:hypothetical protein
VHSHGLHEAWHSIGARDGGDDDQELCFLSEVMLACMTTEHKGHGRALVQLTRDGDDMSRNKYVGARARKYNSEVTKATESGTAALTRQRSERKDASVMGQRRTDYRASRQSSAALQGISLACLAL